MNDAFIFAIIPFIEGYYAKKISDEATKKIIEIDAYYIQFKTFSYLRVAGMNVNPKKLPRYPCDTHTARYCTTTLVYIRESKEETQENLGMDHYYSTI